MAVARSCSRSTDGHTQLPRITCVDPFHLTVVVVLLLLLLVVVVAMVVVVVVVVVVVRRW